MGQYPHPRVLRIEQYITLNGAPEDSDDLDDYRRYGEHHTRSYLYFPIRYGSARGGFGDGHLAGNSRGLAVYDILQPERTDTFPPPYMETGQADYAASVVGGAIAVPNEFGELLCGDYHQQPTQALRRGYGDCYVWGYQPRGVCVCDDCDGIEPRDAAYCGIQLRCETVSPYAPYIQTDGCLRYGYHRYCLYVGGVLPRVGSAGFYPRPRTDCAVGNAYADYLLLDAGCRISDGGRQPVYQYRYGGQGDLPEPDTPGAVSDSADAADAAAVYKRSAARCMVEYAG